MTMLLRSGSLHPGRPDTNSRVHLALRSGRDRVQIKRWWNSGSRHKNYIDCSAVVLDGTNGCQYTLVWPHNYDTRLDIMWAANSGVLTFKMFRQASHAALLCMDGSVLTHWVFGNRPGQKATAYEINSSCSNGCSPGGDIGGNHCWTIPELPTIDTEEQKATLSTSLFTICTDIPGLPPL